jgi:hypothetical protein
VASPSKRSLSSRFEETTAERLGRFLAAAKRNIRIFSLPEGTSSPDVAERKAPQRTARAVRTSQTAPSFRYFDAGGVRMGGSTSFVHHASGRSST